MRSIFVIVLIFGSFALTVSAQSESDLKTYFEGKQVTLRIDVPATAGGVNVYPERAHSLNYDEYNKRLKDHGASMQRGEKATITKLNVRSNHIEVQFSDSSRFNLHFDHLDSWMLTPATVVDALNRYVAFKDSDKNQLSYNNLLLLRPGMCDQVSYVLGRSDLLERRFDDAGSREVVRGANNSRQTKPRR